MVDQRIVRALDYLLLDKINEAVDQRDVEFWRGIRNAVLEAAAVNPASSTRHEEE